MVAALVGLGCNNESTICDNSGCRVCDAIGCRSIDGPSECVRNVDCSGPEFRCVNGACERDPGYCGEDGSACTQGICVDHRCRGQNEICRFNAECGANQLCVNAECVRRCSSEADRCPTGQACDTGRLFCTDLPPPVGMCTEQAMCGGGGACLDSACATNCAPGMCGSDEFCDANFCAPDTRVVPQCQKPTDCPDGPCVRGRCRRACENDDNCRVNDMQLKCEQYCITEVEQQADCAFASDCNADEVCLNGRCTN